MQKVTLYKVLLLASWLILSAGAAGAQDSVAPSLKALLEYPVDEAVTNTTAKITQPVISATPVQKTIETPVKNKPPKKTKKESSQKVPEAKIAKAQNDAPVPARKPEKTTAKPAANSEVTTYAIPSQFLAKPANAPAQTRDAETKSVKAPLLPTPVASAPPMIQAAIVPPPAALIPEPEPQPKVATPPVQEIVSFPIKASVKKMGDLDPAKDLTEITTATGLEEETNNALAAAMAMMDGSGKGYWWQANPRVLFDVPPVPKHRPAKGMASETFVREARQQFVDTYTIVKREGDKMPAVPKTKVVKEPLAAPRLSIADIPGDVLASQIVDMSPQEVAHALNAMTPNSVRDQDHLRRELNAVSKPRIVREQGEWIRKDKSGNTPDVPSRIEKTAATPLDDVAQKPSLKDKIKHPLAFLKGKDEPEKETEQPEKTATAPATLTQPARTGPLMVVYKTGEIEIPAQFVDLISQNIVTTMKNTPESRVQIVAYAAAPDGKEATARRTSLSRALSVRSYLIAQGIDATRLDVRAMGLQTDQKAEADKVDMILIPVQSAKKT